MNFFFPRILMILMVAWIGSGATSQADILVYLLKGGSAKGKKIDDGNTTAWPGIPKTYDTYLVSDLNGIDLSTFGNQITRLEKTLYPSQANFNHATKEKQIYGNIAQNIGYDVYGRSRDAKGKRIFTWLHLQRDGRASSDGARDSGAGVAQGAATWMDIGTGRSGYYASKLSFQIWRLDGGFSGTFGTTQDGRQTKYASAVLNLDLNSTRAINNLGLGTADGVVWLIENLFPSYTELPPDVEGE